MKNIIELNQKEISYISGGRISESHENPIDRINKIIQKTINWIMGMDPLPEKNQDLG